MVFLFFFFFLRRPKHRRFLVFYLGPEVVVGRKRNHWPKLVLNLHPHRSKSVASHGRHRSFYLFALPSPALKAVTNRPISRSGCTEDPLNVINNLSDVSLINSTLARNLLSPSPTPTPPPTPNPHPRGLCFLHVSVVSPTHKLNVLFMDANRKSFQSGFQSFRSALQK